MEIAPGSILQRMHIKRRLKTFSPKTFCEIGSGNGYISNLLLKQGLTGFGYDLNDSACEKNRALNINFINEKKYAIYNSDFFNEEVNQLFDIILSCMVIEHLPEDLVSNYFEICNQKLTPNGKIIILVPSSMKYWGIEDEIAGHYKRYEFEDIESIAKEHNLLINDLSGLTYPVSNILFSLSNKLITNSESYKTKISMQEQTILSGNRNVKFKTTFPAILKLILNEYILFPFYLVQKLNKNNKNSMVIYAEFSKK